MTTSPSILYADIDNLLLDPKNPRLGRGIASPNLDQEKVMDAMRDWTLDELAVSFLESGFWPQEALIVVEEELYGRVSLVVIEGNRRLAALKYLKKATDGSPKSKQWSDLVSGRTVSEDLFNAIPYIKVENRLQVSAYLGFRHVTGIKEWNPAEKAQYIAKLIEEEQLSYDDVRRKIGSKTPTVRQNYISYRLLLQMEQQDSIDINAVEDKFSVLYLSLRTKGVQNYLHINIHAEPGVAINPVPEEHLEKLVHFSQWLFGNEKTPPLFSDSRYVDRFGKVLESEDAVEYLERTPNPRFEFAYRKAGAGEQDLINLIQSASDNIQLALTDVYMFQESAKVQKVVSRVVKDTHALLAFFPELKKEILQEMCKDAGNS